MVDIGNAISVDRADRDFYVIIRKLLLWTTVGVLNDVDFEME